MLTPGYFANAWRTPFSLSFDHWAAASTVKTSTLPLGPIDLMRVSPITTPEYARSCPTKERRLEAGLSVLKVITGMPAAIALLITGASASVDDDDTAIPDTPLVIQFSSSETCFS